MKIKQSEFFYQVGALILSFVIVHTVYVGLVRPNAEIVLEKERQVLAQQASGEVAGAPIKRSAWVVLKDYEQESCFILLLWAMCIMGLKAKRAISERKELDNQLIAIAQGRKILESDARKLARPLEELPEPRKHYLLPRALRGALMRYGTGASIQDVSTTIKDICETEATRLDSELAMVRYIAWAIPSIGFIGTVRGIGDALGNAHEAVAGNIAAVTSSLGVAFNSTFIALLISILIMFLTHQLTLLQERLVLDTQYYMDDELVKYLQAHS